MTTAAPALTLLSQRLADVVAGLCRMVAARGGRNPAITALVVAAWTRLNRSRLRFAALVRRIASGRRAPVRRAGQTRARAARAGAAPKPAFRLPRDFAWLLREMQETAQLRPQIEALLDDPAMVALLAAEPSAARILRPLCRMLGIENAALGSRAPAWMRAPRKMVPLKVTPVVPESPQVAPEPVWGPRWVVWTRSD